ncbi:MAG TPA: hypothetical protein VF884_09705 [Nitrososphaeraceae archaeon]
MLRKQLREVLTVIRDLDKFNGGIYDVIIYEHFRHLPKEETNYSLNELLINGCIAEGVKSTVVKFRLFHITKEGLQKLSN